MPTLALSPSVKHPTEPLPNQRRRHTIDMRHVATIILGGGQGSRLAPLTTTCCKPAISYGGRYRLIDIPVSNSINSGCQKIFVLTQFLSRSLHQHLFSTYRLDHFSAGFIEVLTAEEKPHTKAWFQGTADAVRQNLEYFIETPADYFLILSGDQLYHMDFRNMLQFAYETEADVVISCLPIGEAEAKRMGVMQIGEDNFITAFHEKPQQRRDLNKMKLSASESRRLRIDPTMKLDYLGSMGIYLFKRKALIDLLLKDPREDFGKHLIPTKVQEGNIAAYIHQGYWEDIGTIESFYKANMALTTQTPPFNCYNEEWPIYTHHNTLPGARISNTQINNSIICEGAIVDADEITHSIIGQRSVIGKDTIISDSFLMGNDFYTLHAENSNLPQKFQIGHHCIIRKAILDKNVHIGNHVQLINKDKRTHYDGHNISIRDGIIIVPRGATIPDGFIL